MDAMVHDLQSAWGEDWSRHPYEPIWHWLFDNADEIRRLGLCSRNEAVEICKLLPQWITASPQSQQPVMLRALRTGANLGRWETCRECCGREALGFALFTAGFPKRFWLCNWGVGCEWRCHRTKCQGQTNAGRMEGNVLNEWCFHILESILRPDRTTVPTNYISQSNPIIPKSVFKFCEADKVTLLPWT